MSFYSLFIEACLLSAETGFYTECQTIEGKQYVEMAEKFVNKKTTEGYEKLFSVVSLGSLGRKHETQKEKCEVEGDILSAVMSEITKDIAIDGYGCFITKVEATISFRD